MSNYKGPYNSFSQNAEPIYNQSNILGTVSQSGGVPTGAIIERGSNANGEFVRYADGTLIQRGVVTLTRHTSIEARGTWTFPTTFAGGTSRYCDMHLRNIWNYSGTDRDLGVARHAVNSSDNVVFRQYITRDGVLLSTDTVFEAWCFAIGRWY